MFVNTKEPIYCITRFLLLFTTLFATTLLNTIAERMTSEIKPNELAEKFPSAIVTRIALSMRSNSPKNNAHFC